MVSAALQESQNEPFERFVTRTPKSEQTAVSGVKNYGFARNQQISKVRCAEPAYGGPDAGFDEFGIF